MPLDQISEWTAQLSPKQTEAWRVIHSPDIDEVLYGGAKGGAKSVFLCYWMFLDCYEIARRHVPEPRQHPIPVGWLGRKVAKHFRETTLDTWKRFIPSCYYRMRGDPPDIIIGERVLIRTGGLDSREALEKFNSAEFARIGVDQAEETSRDDVGVLRATRRLVIDGAHIPGKIVYTANPAACWLKQEFIDYPQPRKLFIPALPRDNPWLPSNYIAVLEDSFAHRPDLLRAYRDGDWSGLSGVDQCILEDWITGARMRIAHEPSIRRLITVDPARFGDDVTVILCLENTRIVDAVILPYCSTTDISAATHAMSVRWGKCPVVVEDVGVGGGVSDQLIQQGCNVIRYNPAAASSNPDKWYNLRAEVWSTVARWFCDGVWDRRAGLFLSLPEPEEDPELAEVWRAVCRQLTWPTYKFRGAKTLLAPKEDIKADHEGVSPDYADAYVQGVWHLPFVEPVVIQDRRGTAARERRRPKDELLHDRMSF